MRDLERVYGRWLDELLAELQSHPDPAFARKAAIQWLDDNWPRRKDECPYCGGEL